MATPYPLESKVFLLMNRKIIVVYDNTKGIICDFFFASNQFNVKNNISTNFYSIIITLIVHSGFKKKLQE